jgi:metal-responsive CopG/Arc/MetJ family transcriptional regulator
MATAPTMKHVGFTVPPPMEEELEQMAKEEHRTKSELFREMVRVYRSYRKRHPEPEIDEEWVMQVLREAQEEEKRNPMTTEEILRESRALAEYGARQAKKVGIDVDDDEVINRIIHEERARWREIQKNRA